MKPSLVRSTRLSGSVKLRCVLGSGSFEGGRGTGPERLRFSALRLSSAARSASAFAARGSCGLRLKRPSGLADFGQALLFVGDPAWHFVAATACAVEFVLLRVGCCRSIKPAIHFSAKLRLARLHAVVAHRLVFGGVRLDLRAVERDMPQLRQPGF